MHCLSYFVVPTIVSLFYRRPLLFFSKNRLERADQAASWLLWPFVWKVIFLGREGLEGGCILCWKQFSAV